MTDEAMGEEMRVAWGLKLEAAGEGSSGETGTTVGVRGETIGGGEQDETGNGLIG